MLQLIKIVFGITLIALLASVANGQTSCKPKTISKSRSVKIIPIDNEYFMHSWLVVSADSSQSIQCILCPTPEGNGKDICTRHRPNSSQAAEKSFKSTFNTIILNFSSGNMHSISMLAPNDEARLLNTDLAGIATWSTNDKSGYKSISIAGMCVHGLGNIYIIIKDKQQTDKEKILATIHQLFALY